MDWEQIAGIVIAGLPLVTAVAGAGRRTDPVRRQMAHDSQVLAALPEGSKAHVALLDVLERAANTLQERQSYSRDKAALALAIIGSLTFGYLTLWLWLIGSWWSLPLAILSGGIWIVFFFGIFDSAQLRDQEAHKRERDRRKEVRKLERETKKQARERKT